MRQIAFIFTLIVLLAAALNCQAGVPRIVYDAAALDVNGALLPDGTYSATFRVYSSSDSVTPVWCETIKNLKVKDGRFHAELGKGNSLQLDWSGFYSVSVQFDSMKENARREWLRKPEISLGPVSESADAAYLAADSPLYEATESTCDASTHPSGNWGTAIGTYGGVTAYSNGADTGSWSSLEPYCTDGYLYQCVEYIRRFYRLHVGMDTSSWYGNANQYYDNGPGWGLEQHANDGTSLPEPDDILCFNGGSWGHVAIVTSVASSQVNIMQQNVSSTTGSGYKSIVNGIIQGSCQGWLHKSGADTTAPVISNVYASNITSVSAATNWTTDDGSNSRVEYGLTSSYGSRTFPNSNLVTNHSVALGGLSANTTYHYRVVSTNGAGLTSYSGDCTFTTASVTSEIIVDDLDSAYVTTTGGWNTGTTAGGYPTSDSEYKYTTSASSSTATFTWRPYMATGLYDVYVWYLAGSNRSATAPYTVSYYGGSTVVNVNQKTDGSQWLKIAGSKPFAVGTSGYVQVNNGTGESSKAVIADAVRWVYVGALTPTITMQPQPQTLCAGSTAVFYVTATGIGTTTYQWQNNGVNISNDGHYSGATSAYLYVYQADANDAGNYRCIVTDSGGSTTSNAATLTVNTVPSAPVDGTPVSTSAYSITWKWIDTPGAETYNVKDTSGYVVSLNVIPGVMQWKENTLIPNASYTRKIYATNDCGESAGSVGQTRYTLAKAGESTDGTGSTGNVYCTTASKNTWYPGSKAFTFSNPAGFGTADAWKASSLEYKWNQSSTEAWSTAGTSWSSGTISLTPTSGSGDYYLHVRAINGDGVANNTDTVDIGPFKVDSTTPDNVTVTDEGAYTPSLDTLKASWTASSDSGSGFDHYEYAVGTNADNQLTKGWTSTSSTSAVISGLSLTEGTTYYIQVRAVDAAGNTSSGSAADGIMAAPGVAKISGAWEKVNSTDPISLRDKVITLSNANEFYLEETDRTSGIKVVSTANPGKGNIASVAGILGLSGSQRSLIGDVVFSKPDNISIPPIGIAGKYLGGIAYNSTTPGITNGYGLYNIGLVVRVWGRIDYRNTTDVNNKYFYIDDGSSLTSGGHKGVKVKCGIVDPPSAGYAAITGVVASEESNGSIVPVVIIRDSGDIN